MMVRIDLFMEIAVRRVQVSNTRPHADKANGSVRISNAFLTTIS